MHRLSTQQFWLQSQYTPHVKASQKMHPNTLPKTQTHQCLANYKSQESFERLYNLQQQPYKITLLPQLVPIPTAHRRSLSTTHVTWQDIVRQARTPYMNEIFLAQSPARLSSPVPTIALYLTQQPSRGLYAQHDTSDTTLSEPFFFSVAAQKLWTDYLSIRTSANALCNNFCIAHRTHINSSPDLWEQIFPKNHTFSGLLPKLDH